MFLQLSVILFTGGEGGVTSPPGRYPLGRPSAPPRRPLQRMVRILLECILVYKFRNYCQLERILNSYRFTSANADYFHWIRLGFDASFNRFLNFSIFPNLDKNVFVFGKVMQCVCVWRGGRVGEKRVEKAVGGLLKKYIQIMDNFLC